MFLVSLHCDFYTKIDTQFQFLWSSKVQQHNVIEIAQMKKSMVQYFVNQMQSSKSWSTPMSLIFAKLQ